MKTAMQELTDYMKTYFHLTDESLEMFDKALEKEKEQLNVSFISGCIEALSYHTPTKDRIKDGYFENKAELYYEHIYNPKK